MTIWLEGFIFGFIHASLIWAIFVHGVPAARRYQLWNRAHCAALNIVARWKLLPIEHAQWAMAIADAFTRRIDAVGYAEAVKEFEQWERLADDTREFLVRPAEPAPPKPSNVIDIRRVK